MDRLRTALVVAGLLFACVTDATRCPKTPLLSCSSESIGVDVSPCCVAQPGLFSYKQNWSSSQKRWTSAELYLLNCNGSEYKCDVAISRKFAAPFVALHVNDEDSAPFSLPAKTSLSTYLADEWARAGGCVSTLGPDCNGPDPKVAVNMWHSIMEKIAERFDVNRIFSNERIYPSPTRVFPAARLEGALLFGSGAIEARIICDGPILQAVEYRFLARGPVQNLAFEASTAPWPASDQECKGEVKYYHDADKPIETPELNSDSRKIPGKKDASKDSLKFFAEKHGMKPGKHGWEREQPPETGAARDEL